MVAKKEKSSIFSLEDQFAFYGSYHTNKINVLIHVICVPMIFQTALILVHHYTKTSYYNYNLLLPSFVSNLLGGTQETLVQATIPFLVALGYATYFILLDPIAGALYAPILLGMGHFSNVYYNSNPQEAMKYAGYAFTASWIAQFIGHGKFEGRAPALFNSLFQSLVLAVFFVFLEVLFYLGYKPALHKRVQNRIGQAVLEYRTEKAAKAKAQ